MQFKTDENIPPDVAVLLREQGHDAVTVWDQKLQGCSDEDIAHVCRTEDRALITLDIDFADIRSYPPSGSPGLIVCRLRSQSRTHLVQILRRVSLLFEQLPLEGRLWIVEEDRVRVIGEDSPHSGP